MHILGKSVVDFNLKDKYYDSLGFYATIWIQTLQISVTLCMGIPSGIIIKGKI